MRGEERKLWQTYAIYSVYMKTIVNLCVLVYFCSLFHPNLATGIAIFFSAAVASSHIDIKRYSIWFCFMHDNKLN